MHKKPPVTLELWLPTNPEIKEVIKRFNKEETEFKQHAMGYLLHHFKPEADEEGKIKYRYARVHHTGNLLQINEKYYLSFLESNGVLQNANEPGMHYYRLSESFRQGRYFSVTVPGEYATRLKTFEKIPTKFVEESSLLKPVPHVSVDYRWW